MALTALNLAGLPLIAGLMAGTGAMATYVVGPTSAPVTASAPAAAIAPKAEPCGAQTWPYIDNRCVAAGTHENRKVRVVMAPRDGVSAATETSGAAPAAMPKMDAPTPAAPDDLVTRDAVARSVATGSPTAVPQVSRRAEQRRVRQENKLARAYQVPSETGRRDRRLIVVRPLRLDIFK